MNASRLRGESCGGRHCVDAGCRQLVVVLLGRRRVAAGGGGGGEAVALIGSTHDMRAPSR
ncbi:MAG TPA: hypothetical protein VGF60_08940 [Xanthobacteraceae bacterium]